MLKVPDDSHLPATTTILFLLVYTSFRIVLYISSSSKDKMKVYLWLAIGDTKYISFFCES